MRGAVAWAWRFWARRPVQESAVQVEFDQERVLAYAEGQGKCAEGFDVIPGVQLIYLPLSQYDRDPHPNESEITRYIYDGPLDAAELPPLLRRDKQFRQPLHKTRSYPCCC